MLPEADNSELNITLTDFTTNVYSLKQSLDESENVIVKCFNDRTKRHFNNLSFTGADHIGNNQSIIIPLVHQNESKEFLLQELH